MLGHATISQTMDTYSHVMPGMSDVAAEAIERALSRARFSAYFRLRTRLITHSTVPCTTTLSAGTTMSSWAPLRASSLMNSP